MASALILLTVFVLAPLHILAANCPGGNPILRRNGLTCEEKQFIVDFHNKIRNHVASGQIYGQPKASNMEEMSWNEELAKLAQKRADSCDFSHGDLELNGERVGQNLAILQSSVDNLSLNTTYMIDLWYNEVFQFGYNGNFDSRTGHYSQLIWGNTREVGCGYTYFKEGGWFKMYFVCDYYPPGNYIGQKPYVIGKLDCKRFGLSDSLNYPKLCTSDTSKVSVCKSEKMANGNAGTSEMETTESPELEVTDNGAQVYDSTTTDANDWSTEIEDYTTRETTSIPTASDNEVNPTDNETNQYKGTAKFFYETIIFTKGSDQNDKGGIFKFKYEPIGPGTSPSQVQLDGVKVSNETAHLASKLIQLLHNFHF